VVVVLLAAAASTAGECPTNMHWMCKPPSCTC